MYPVLSIQIHNFFLDLDPELLFQIQKKMTEQINNNNLFLILGLRYLDCVMYSRTVVWNRKWQIIGTGRFFYFWMTLRCGLKKISKLRLGNISGSGSLKFVAGSGYEINHSGSTTLSTVISPMWMVCLTLASLSVMFLASSSVVLPRDCLRWLTSSSTLPDSLLFTLLSLWLSSSLLSFSLLQEDGKITIQLR